MAAELEWARTLERRFLMSVSHDLRTPLTSIRGYAEAIADGAADDDETRARAAAVIGSEARRLEREVRLFPAAGIAAGVSITSLISPSVASKAQTPASGTTWLPSWATTSRFAGYGRCGSP